MATMTVYGLEIPQEVWTLTGFRNWVGSLGDEAPRVHYSQGGIHVEMSAQSYKSHEPLVDAINWTLRKLAREMRLGRYYAPPSWFTEEQVDLSTEPDGSLVKWGSFKSGRVRINPDREREMLGRPDMALEVVSKSSVKKDLEELIRDYASAGVEEYWIADALGEKPVFRILLLGEDGHYHDQSPDDGGWLHSRIWCHSFSLRRFVDEAGLIDFDLEYR